MENNKPTAEQIQALVTFANANGRTWKSNLRHCWEAGCYDLHSGTERMDLLQQIRNSFGPSWLVRFRLPSAKPEGLEGLELTNSEGAMVEGLAHFLKFMKTESAPVPETGDELAALLTRYMKTIRREQMAYISDLRVKRGESPLPASLVEGR